jgi:hypothetical protein
VLGTPLVLTWPVPWLAGPGAGCPALLVGGTRLSHPWHGFSRVAAAPAAYTYWPKIENIILSHMIKNSIFVHDIKH